ncbi:hypothetical protein ACFVXQ_15495 [Kitasatospora sp. NPDC058263]
MVGEWVPGRERVRHDGSEPRRLVHPIDDGFQYRRANRLGRGIGTAAVRLSDPARVGGPVTAHRIGQVVDLVALHQTGRIGTPRPVAVVPNDHARRE